MNTYLQPRHMWSRRTFHGRVREARAGDWIDLDLGVLGNRHTLIADPVDTGYGVVRLRIPADRGGHVDLPVDGSRRATIHRPRPIIDRHLRVLDGDG